ARGYNVLTIDDPITGEARVAASKHLDKIAARFDTASRPLCIVSAGETVVTVSGKGKGGRNQEFALAAAERVAAIGMPALVASAGTDGIDGPTDAAGAFVDHTTMARAASAGLGNPQRYL